MNHLANGAFHSSTFRHFLNQCSSSACFAKNVFGSLMLAAYIRSYAASEPIVACEANAFDGLKSRFSVSRDSICVEIFCSLPIVDHFSSTKIRVTPLLIRAPLIHKKRSRG